MKLFSKSEDEAIVRSVEPTACVAKQRKATGMRYQIVKRQIITTKLPPLGGWCTTEAAAWKSAAERMRKRLNHEDTEELSDGRVRDSI
jgi:hypothetical protein